MDLIDIYRTFHPKAADYAFFSRAHRTFSRKDPIWATNQASVNLRKLKSYQAPFMTTLQLEINKKKPAKKSQTHGD